MFRAHVLIVRRPKLYYATSGIITPISGPIITPISGPDKIDNVSRDAENKITSLNNTFESVRECMNERINAHVVQTRKETDRQGQERTAASSSLLASIKEQK